MSRFVLAVLIMGCVLPTVKAKADDEFFSLCAAYAFIRTGDFPEVAEQREQVEENAWAITDPRLRQGIAWTNRVQLLRQWTGFAVLERTNKIPTNGDISALVASHVQNLNTISPLERESIGSLCYDLYQIVDDVCRTERCFLDVRPR